MMVVSFQLNLTLIKEVKMILFFCLFDVEETPRCVGLSKHEGMITGAYTVLGSVIQTLKIDFYTIST